MNQELRQLYEADQGDRSGEDFPPEVIERDRARRGRVTELLDAGAAETGEDFFHAAMVFQHGDELSDYLRAHELALRAAELGHRGGRWLAAAAHDRWLMHQGKPQKYGTQYRGTPDGYELYEVDPATTDEERAEWDVPPLAEARRRAAELEALRSTGRLSSAPALTYRAGDLEIEVHRMPAGTAEPRMPTPTPPEAGDPVPSWLPPRLTAGRTQFGFVAVDTSGEFQLVWFPASTPMAMGWREEDGELPQPETVEVAGSPAIWCGSMLLFRRPNGELWSMGGKYSREELIRAAESLP